MKTMWIFNIAAAAGNANRPACVITKGIQIYIIALEDIKNGHKSQ